VDLGKNLCKKMLSLAAQVTDASIVLALDDR
jgi:hypothetical protein